MKFTVYSKDGCPYCTKVQQVLQLAELQHVVYKLGVDFTREEFYSEFGNGSTFPQVIVNDNLFDISLSKLVDNMASNKACATDHQ